MQSSQCLKEEYCPDCSFEKRGLCMQLLSGLMKHLQGNYINESDAISQNEVNDENVF